jgi:glycosyltransferase involved in cell wall biosynthesis
MRTFLEAGVPQNKLILTPLGVDLELFQPAPSPRSESTFRIIFVGRISQPKGISYLLEAFERADLPRSELLLVGQPIGAYHAWGGMERVRQVDPVPRWQLPALYVTADVYVLPSLFEGFPQTALEAMACGLPVVVSENTFGSDLVTDGVEGYVVPIRDSAIIATRLQHLYQNPDERTRMGISARRRAEEFSWDRYGRGLVNAIAPEVDANR